MKLVDNFHNGASLFPLSYFSLPHRYFVLATEAHDDDGLPHTLEHLIFLGSELYPYKGTL